MNIKNGLFFVFVGTFLTIIAMLAFQKKQIVYVSKNVPVEVVKYVEKPVEIEKIIYKKRNCKISDEQKLKLCSEFISSLPKDDDKKQVSLSNDHVIIESKNSVANVYKNRINFHVGYGKSGYDLKYDGSNISAQEKNGMIFGLQYERKLSTEYSGSIMIQNNSSLFVGGGKDF